MSKTASINQSKQGTAPLSQASRGEALGFTAMRFCCVPVPKSRKAPYT